MKKVKSKNIEAIAKQFYDLKQQEKNISSKLEDMKYQFYDEMDAVCDKIGEDTFGVDVGLADGALLNLTKVENSKVEVLSISKLENALGKDYAKSVIKKRYNLFDMHSLLVYLKGLGADLKIVRSFFDVEKSVDFDALDILYDTGKIDKPCLEDCFEVKTSKRYYKTKVVCND
jgi:hypothetical protein